MHLLLILLDFDQHSNNLLAGKSTLLQILAGKRLVTAVGSDLRIKDRDVFRDSPPGVTFLGTEWFFSLPLHRFHHIKYHHLQGQ